METIKQLRGHWDRALAVVLALAGLVALVAGWFGVSDTALVAEQLPYLVSGGLGGLFLLGVAASLWLSGDLRDEWDALDRIQRSIDDRASELVLVERRDGAGFRLDRAAVPANGADEVPSDQDRPVAAQ
jgi:hypothetical protein